MKEYYEKKVKQDEMIRKFVVDGIKAELADADIKKEDLEFYAELIEKVDAELQFVKDKLAECRGEKKNA